MGLPMTLPSNTGSTETWSTIDRWVHECSEQHRCLAQVTTDWYPTRLVERISSEKFRVIRSDSGLFSPGRGYITLSHRWGDRDFVKLTRDKLSDFEDGLPIRLLRKTFQEALVVAWRMNIPFVWIDSLCIIQSGDNGADWRQESRMMAEVYSNSFCNISADWGDESNGLFFKRTPAFEPPCSLRTQWKIPKTNDGNLDDLHVLETPPDGCPSHIVLRDFWFENVMESPLNRRGWVLQERLLAPRVLHFSPKQVSWECGQKLAWETAPLYSVTSPHANSILHCLGGYGRTRISLERLKLDKTRRAVDWSSLVERYSGCELTRQSDKLVAIAGIARRLAHVAEDQYVAGLWAKQMPQVLLWEAYGTKHSCCPPTQYYAPTFSWAAADGKVVMPSDRGDRITATASFIEHRKKTQPSAATKTMQTNLEGQILMNHVFGPLTSPEVEVRMRGILRSCQRVPSQLIPAKRSRYWGCPSLGVGDSAIDLCFSNGTAFTVSYDRAAEKDAQADSTTYYYTIIECVCLFSDQRSNISKSYVQARGLFLKSVDVSMGRFERVGYVSHFNGKNAGIYEPLGNERDLPAWSYDETSGEHTFYVV